MKERENIERQCGCFNLDVKESWGDGVFQYNVIKE